MMPGVNLYDFEHEIHYDENLGASVSFFLLVLNTAWKASSVAVAPSS